MNPRLFRHIEIPLEPDRPSHFREDQNEREILPEQDFPTEVSEQEAFGFAPAANPVPVYLVESPPNDVHSTLWAPVTVEVTTTPIKLIDEDRRRRRLLIRNLGSPANDVYLGPADTVKQFVGYTLQGTGSQREIEMTHTGEVWAIASTETAKVTLFAEYDPEDS